MTRLPATPDDIVVIVEIPKGSRNKYEMDPETGRIRLDRVLFASVHYPTDYGYIEGTLGGDGDTLDALVLIDEPTFPGCQLSAHAVGMLVMSDEKGEDEKILCVPSADPLWNRVQTLDDVPTHLLTEIEHFFSTYKNLEGKPTTVKGWLGREEALRTIAVARKDHV